MAWVAEVSMLAQRAMTRVRVVELEEAFVRTWKPSVHNEPNDDLMLDVPLRKILLYADQGVEKTEPTRRS